MTISSELTPEEVTTWEVFDPDTAHLIAVFHDHDAMIDYLRWANKKRRKAEKKNSVWWSVDVDTTQPPITTAERQGLHRAQADDHLTQLCSSGGRGDDPKPSENRWSSWIR